MILQYNARDWYWKVAGSITQVYSSKVGDYVPVNNAIYLAWIALGNSPTKIDTEANLGDVLAAYSLRPVAAGVLDGYTDSQATALPIDAVRKVLFNHENRIRALEAKQPVSSAQFKAFLKSLI